jgi:hypothetical protein
MRHPLRPSLRRQPRWRLMCGGGGRGRAGGLIGGTRAQHHRDNRQHKNENAFFHDPQLDIMKALLSARFADAHAPGLALLVDQCPNADASGPVALVVGAEIRVLKT